MFLKLFDICQFQFSDSGRKHALCVEEQYRQGCAVLALFFLDNLDFQVLQVNNENSIVFDANGLCSGNYISIEVRVQLCESVVKCFFCQEKMGTFSACSSIILDLSTLSLLVQNKRANLDAVIYCTLCH